MTCRDSLLLRGLRVCVDTECEGRGSSNHPIYRCLWGWLGAPEVGLLKLFQGPVIRQAAAHAYVVQESIMPTHRLAEGVRRFDDWFGVYPLLVFPVRIFDRGPMSGFLRPEPAELDEAKHQPVHPSGKQVPSGLWVDLGAYGVPRLVKEGKSWDAKKSCRAMEHWTRDVKGWCAVYTDIFCTHKEFRAMFDHSLIDKCRKRLQSTDAFPEIYTKVKPEEGIANLEAELKAEHLAECCGKGDTPSPRSSEASDTETELSRSSHNLDMFLADELGSGDAFKVRNAAKLA